MGKEDKNQDTLTIWQTCVEMANGVSQRRDTMFSLRINDQNCPSDIRDVQKTISLADAIEELRTFDDEKLFPYVESLFIQLEDLVKPSPLIF